jgi:hypothetical protein
MGSRIYNQFPNHIKGLVNKEKIKKNITKISHR